MSGKQSYGYLKWMNLLGFAFLYNTIYIGRFGLNNVVQEIALQCGISLQHSEMIASSVFLTYAIGSLINGRVVDAGSPKKIVTCGVIVSVVCNILLVQLSFWQGVLVVWLLNGYFQSMIWISGISLLSKWFASKERGVACGMVNFFSGLSHVTAYLIPLLLVAIFPYLSWKELFTVPTVFMLLFLIIFWWITVDTPQQTGKEDYIEENPLVAGREQPLKTEVRETHGNPWKYFFSRPKFLWWCGIAMLSSLCRYGLLKWIPLYFMGSEDVNALLSPVFSNLILPLGMAFGTLTLTWTTGKVLNNNKGIVVIISAALCGTLVIIFPTIQYSQAILIGIFCTGFFLYGINGILWIYAMDRGGRIYSGTVAGILNCCAYLGAALESVVFPFVLHVTGQMISLFIIMEIFCIGMVICGMVVCEKDTTIESEQGVYED